MKVVLSLCLLIALLPSLCGCGGSATSPPTDVAPGQSSAAAIPDTTMEAEVGCAACIYAMDGIKSCTTAAKIGDEVRLVQGGGVDAHAAGLCKTARNATIVGHVEGDTLVASSVTLQ